MRLSAQSDIRAPAAKVWAALTDVAAVERAGLKRGVDVTRVDEGGPVAPGAEWRIAFEFRGRRRSAVARLLAMDPDERIQAGVRGEGLESLAEAELVALSPGTTRLLARVDFGAVSFQGRLLLQTMKLMRGALQRRLEDRVDRFARRLSD